MAMQTSLRYCFGPFTLDPAGHRLLRAGEPVRLHPKAFDLLLTLVRSAGRTVSKDELLSGVWGGTFVEEGVLAVNVSALRKALGDAKGSQQYIETVPKCGYRFAADVLEEGGGGSAPPQAATSLAVLPFAHPGRGAEELHLGLSLADALVERLSRIRDVLVRPTDVVFQYLDSDRDPAEIGRLLGVDWVLVGSVSAVDRRLVVSARLLSVDDEARWEGSFDVDPDDLYAAEQAISERVAGTLLVDVKEEERGGMLRRRTEDPEARRAYMISRYLFLQGTPEGFAKSTEWARRAADLDPGYALALVALAQRYVICSGMEVLPPHTAMPPAKAAAERALAADDTLADAHATLAFIRLTYDWDLAGAEAGFRRSLELSPSGLIPHYWHAIYLMVAGRPEESFAELRLAMSLYPAVDRFAFSIRDNLAWFLYFVGRYDEAEDELRQVLEIDPQNMLSLYVLVQCHVQRGRHEEAEGLLLGSGLLESPDCSSFLLTALGCAYAAAGKRGAAEAVLRRVEIRSTRAYVSPYLIAQIYAGLGDDERALSLLERAREERSYRLLLLRHEPAFESLRGEERFERLLIDLVPGARP